MRFSELITDPSSGQLSTSRLGLLMMNILAVFVSAALLYLDRSIAAATVVTGVAGTDAGVYFASTRKDGKDGNDGKDT
jgi:hypothetical protein